MEPTSSPINPKETSEESPVEPSVVSAPESESTFEPESVSDTPPEPAISQTFTPAEAAPAPPPPFTPADSSTPSAPAEPAPTESITPAAPAPIAADIPDQPGGITPPAPGVVVGGSSVGSVVSSATVAGAAVPGKKRSKKLLFSAIAVVVIAIVAAGVYFGYYMNPNVIYSQSLKDTGKGYDKLVDYANQQSKIDYKGYIGTGSYSIKTDGFSTDGKIGVKSGGSNGELTFDVGLEATRVSADIRTIKSTGTVPDIYVKADGIKGLGTLMGLPALDADLAKLDGNWIVIDHTLLDNAGSSATGSDSSTITPPTHDQILDEARAFGKVNQEYLLSTAKDKAVTKVTRKYGKETVDGHKTYHYQIVLQKDNVKKYILAQRDALKASTLNDWLKKNKLDKSAYDSLTDAANSTKDIKSSDTYDIWADINQRVIYKVRFNGDQNPADNYVDVGLNYTGGSNYPFFVSGKSKDSSGTTTFALTTTVDTKSNVTSLKLDASEPGTDGGTVTADFSLKPSTAAVTIDKPSNAIPLSQVVSELGLNDVFGGVTGGATSTDGSAGIQLGNKQSATGSTAGTSAKSIPDLLFRRLLNQ